MFAWLLHSWAEAGRSNKYSTIRQFLQVFRKQRIASHSDSSFEISTEQCKFQYRLAAKDACRDNGESLQYSTQDAQPVGSFLIICAVVRANNRGRWSIWHFYILCSSLS